MLPPFNSTGATWSAGQHNVTAAKNLVQFDGVGQVLARSERLETVVRRITAQAKIVHLRADVFGVSRRPLEVRRVELNHFVTELGNCLERDRQVARQLASD